MAIIKSSVIGKMKGKAGQFNFRNQKGKNIMSIRPEKVNVSQTPQAKRARKDLAMAVKVSKTINSVPELKAIWTMAKIDASNSFQKLMRINLKTVKNTSATILNKITPDGLTLNLTSCSLQNNELNLEFNLPTSENMQFPAGIFIMFYLDKFNKSVFISKSEIEKPSSNGSYQKKILLDKEIADGLKVDSHPIIYFAVAGAAPFKRKQYWTSTEARQL